MVTPAMSSSATLPEPGISPTPQKPTSGWSETITLIYALLVNRSQPYLTASKGRWYYRHENLTPSVVRDALEGSLALGLVTVSGRGQSRWLCLDADTQEASEALLQLAKDLPSTYTLYEPSRRGSHLFVFHKQCPWQHSQAYGHELLTKAGIKSVEVYPRSGEVNAVRLPGTVHPKDGIVYQPVDPGTGEILSLADALSQIRPITLPPSKVVKTPTVRPSVHSSDDFEELVKLLSTLTKVSVYGENKAKAICVWHPDTNPSLLVRGGRFHCARQDCVWGDIHDLRRWIDRNIRPPHH